MNCLQCGKRLTQFGYCQTWMDNVSRLMEAFTQMERLTVK